MTVQEFVEKAIEGGWAERHFRIIWKKPKVEIRLDGKVTLDEGNSMGFTTTHQILLDPEAWRAVGKVEGWEKKNPARGWEYEEMSNGAIVGLLDAWECNMHSFMQALIEGKTAQQYLSTL